MKNDPLTATALAPVLETLLSRARHYGAEKCDGIATHGRSLSVVTRGGNLEDVDNSEGKDIGLRVFIGKRQACVSSSDLSYTSLDKLAERAVAMARLAPEDEYCGLAHNDLLEHAPPALDLFDPAELSPADLLERANTVEAAALAVKGVKQAEGASASANTSAVYFATSEGFSSGWRGSRFSMGVSAFAEGDDGAMERDYDYHGARFIADVKDMETIGRTAGQRAVARLGGTQLSSSTMSVIMDRRVSNALLSAFTGAITGSGIARGVSFLKDKMDSPLFAKNITIIDDPLIPRGHGSRPWDGEGVQVQRQILVNDGVLKSWLLNTSSARQLGMITTGHASRPIGSPPGISPTNCYIETGEKSPEQLMADIGSGLLVTEMFGPSLNSNTGDYSVGVSGFQIQGGDIARPVNEVTIAGNLLDMFAGLIPANDLVFDNAVVTPSLLIPEMTLAGT